MTSELKSSYVSHAPIDKVWKMSKEAACGKLKLKVMPAYFSDIDILEGGEGAGTVRLVTMGEAVGPQGAGQKVKEVVDVVDEKTHTITTTVLEGGDPRYTNVKFTVKLAPAGETTNVEWICNYTPVDASVPPPEQYKKMADVTSEAMKAYAKDHASEVA